MDMTISLGITSAIPEGNKEEITHSIEAMIEKADIALYRAKETGRNRIEAYE
jgi:PleD family two-component response regulator